MTQEIGGFVELELKKGKHFHKNAILLNSARNALRYALRAYNVREIYAPYYTCPVVWQAIETESCTIIPYEIDEYFMPKVRFDKKRFVLYTNYFGICAKQIKTLARLYPNLLVDNAMGFYMKHFGLASLYSPRKFFGVADGGILLCSKKIDEKFPKDTSYQRFSHLIKRVDGGSNFAYEDFNQNNDSLIDEPIKQMSNLTNKMLKGYDYTSAKIKRLKNFDYLARKLHSINLLKDMLNYYVDGWGGLNVPMHYPLLLKNATKAYKELLDNQIYCPKPWRGMLDLIGNHKCKVERNFYANLIPLIIDQRYGKKDLDRIVSIIKGSYK